MITTSSIVVKSEHVILILDDFVILTYTYPENITFLVNDTEKYEIVNVSCKLLGRMNVDYHGNDAW